MKARISFFTESLEAQSGGANAQKDDSSADASMSIARAALMSIGLWYFNPGASVSGSFRGEGGSKPTISQISNASELSMPTLVDESLRQC